MKTEKIFTTWKNEISENGGENVKMEFEKQGKAYILRLAIKGVQKSNINGVSMLFEDLMAKISYKYDFTKYTGKRNIDKLRQEIEFAKDEIFEAFEKSFEEKTAKKIFNCLEKIEYDASGM